MNTQDIILLIMMYQAILSTFIALYVRKSKDKFTETKVISADFPTEKTIEETKITDQKRAFIAHCAEIASKEGYVLKSINQIQESGYYTLICIMDRVS